ncbi:DUF2953 domain-containing protein [Paenibacillus sp. MBLB4367]|uniref:DUF2953 domain-containing protein n=1 Tax=Paenibacillus sp. MBLB4367 TaxID=3384767 RepID=UPI00390816FC
MMSWLWAGAVAVALLAVLLASRIRLKLYFSRVGADDHLFVEARALFGIVRFKYEVPIIRFLGIFEGIEIRSETVDRKKNVLMDGVGDNVSPDRFLDLYRKANVLLERIVGFADWVKGTLARVHCTQLQWATYIGIGDAAQTAVLTGAIWGLKTSLLGILFRFVKLDAKPELLVQPQYNRMQFATKVRFMFQMRLGVVLLAGMRLLVRYIRGNRAYKRRKTKLESNPAS